IGDARIEIDELYRAPQADGRVAQSVSRRWERPAWISAMLLTLIAAVAIVRVGRTPASVSTMPEVRLDITTQPTTNQVSLALSPNGQKMAYAAISEGVTRLWLRSLDSSSARPLPGTDGAKYPFWSPDNRSIGFFANDKLKRIDIDDGSVHTLVDAPIGDGGTWNRDGVILFSRAPRMRIFRVSDRGGEPAALAHLDAQPGSHRFPQFLPDGHHF